MLDVSFSELLLVLLLAFVAIGPKELPVVLRHVARYVREFRAFRESMRGQLREVAGALGVEDFHATGTMIDLNGRPQPTFDVTELEGMKVARRQSSVVSETLSDDTPPNDSRLTTHD